MKRFHDSKGDWMRCLANLALGLALSCPIWTINAASPATAQEYCGACQGRCQYCVDGQCIPRRHTFGHYQTHWRRWPEPPPSLPVSGDILGTEDASIDLPDPADEGSVDPDLANRRERTDALPYAETPTEAEFEGAKPDPFEDDENERVPNPAPALEGSTSRNMPRPFRVHSAPYASVPAAANPLRGIGLPPVNYPGRNEARHVGYFSTIEAQPARPAPYQNPLR